MRNFLRAILNEWKQHWQPLLFLFVAEALLFMVWIFASEYANLNLLFEAKTYCNEFCLLAMMILYCGIPVIMAPNLLTDPPSPDNPDKHYAASGHGVLYWIKFIAGSILFIFPILVLFAPKLISTIFLPDPSFYIIIMAISCLPI